MNEVYQRVVLVDNEPIQNKIHKLLIQRYLGRHCIEIVSFTDPVQALLYLEDENANQICTLVMLDLNMPNLDGWEFLDHLNHVDMNRTIIYIISSSLIQSDIERAGNHPKVTGYAKKPLSSAINGLLVNTLSALEKVEN